jgi:putative colanic acid biosynthesis acetyltransferase WcaF
MNGWRILWLRLFGAEITGRPFVHQRARVEMPWNVCLHDKACVGDRAALYSLGKIEIQQQATVAQEVYLCAGSHDFQNPTLPLTTSPIFIEVGAFVGARAFVLPGIKIGSGAIVGACSVVTQNVPARTIVAGNPARKIRMVDDWQPGKSNGTK